MNRKIKLLFIVCMCFLLVMNNDVASLSFSQDANSLIVSSDSFITSGIFLGGNQYDEVLSSSIDSFGNIVLAGTTRSSNFPLVKAYDSTYDSDEYYPAESFVTKMTLTGSIQWSTFLGGSSIDKIFQVVIDSTDSVIVAGYTGSSNFPTYGPSNTTYNGGEFDIFLTKFFSNGSICWSKLIGGSDSDVCFGLSLDSKDNIVIVGETASSDFPVYNSLYPHSGGLNGYDCFITKLSSDGSLLWSTFYGGSGDDFSPILSIDYLDNIIIGGYTSSTDLPIINGFDSTYNINYDVFLVKFNSIGSLLWSTYFGSSTIEYIESIATDVQGNILFTGWANPNAVGFPLTHSYGTRFNNSIDVFVVKFSSNGSLVWSFDLGAEDREIPTKVSTDPFQNLYITGFTFSEEFPGREDYGRAFDSSQDIFVSKITPNGSLAWSLCLGGTSWDTGTNIVALTNFTYLLTGYTGSNDFFESDVGSVVDGTGFLCILKDPLMSDTTTTSISENVTISTNHISSTETIPGILIGVIIPSIILLVKIKKQD